MSGAGEVREVKRALRGEMLARRADLHPAERTAAAAAVRARLLALLRGIGGPVALYRAIRGEIDLDPLAAALAAHGRTLALPVVVRRNAPMVFRRWRPGDPLVPGLWDIPVPPPEAEELVPAVVVLPVLGVGPRGHRLGYGGGYYDRTLAVLRPRPLVIGVGHDFVRLAALPVTAHDQPLDLLVTPGSAIAFSDRVRRRDVRAR